MYAALWSVLPGPAWLRAIIVVILVAVILAALFTVVFPWVSSILAPQDVTVG